MLLEEMMNNEAIEALKAVLDAWHAEDRNMERNEPGYLEKVRRALARAEGGNAPATDAHYSAAPLIDELTRERKKSRVLLEALEVAETLISADIVRDDAGCLTRVRAAIAHAKNS